MPSVYQKNSLRTLLGLYLKATGQALPQHSEVVSPSALSRFLNKYNWPCRAVIRMVRSQIVAQIQAERHCGRRPILQVILDMTCLEKEGKFKGLGKLIRVYNGKRGLHLVVLYIQLGERRLPWGFRVYRGQGERSHIQLAQRLLLSLPKALTQRFEVRILADSAFGSTQMLQWVKQRKRTSAIFGVSCDLRFAAALRYRRLADGRHVNNLLERGQQVYLWVWISPSPCHGIGWSKIMALGKNGLLCPLNPYPQR
jgi:hypothetical protein